MPVCVSLNLSFIHWAVYKEDQCRVSQACYPGAATASISFLKRRCIAYVFKIQYNLEDTGKKYGATSISKSDVPSHLTKVLVLKQDLPGVNLGISSLLLPNTENNLKSSPMRRKFNI